MTNNNHNVQHEFDEHDWALIIGGSRGFGLASAKKLAAHELNILIVHRDRRSDLPKIEADFEEIKATEVNFMSFNKNATQSKSIHIILDQWQATFPKGKIKLLLHSIAKGNVNPLLSNDNELSEQDFQITIDAMGINLFTWVKAVLKNNLFAKPARILSFTSEGNEKVWSGYSAVAAAKATLETITKHLAVELASKRITANCLQPGCSPTSSFQKIPGHEQLERIAKEKNPYSRLTTPQDVANVVYLLCKQEAEWINGAIIPVNGGEHLR